MANVGDVTVKLQADLGSFTSGMAQAQAETSRIGIAMAHLEQPAFGATRGLREMEFAMRTMAVQAAGATGGVGNMVAGFTQLLVSGPVMLGLLAAFAAFGFALNKVKKDEEEFTKSLEAHRKVFDAHIEAIERFRPTQEHYGELVRQLTDLQNTYNQAFGQTGDFLHDLIHNQTDMSDGAIQLRRQIMATAEAINVMNRELENERLTRWLEHVEDGAHTMQQVDDAITAVGEKMDSLERQMNAQTPGSDRWAALRRELIETGRVLETLRREWKEALAEMLKPATEDKEGAFGAPFKAQELQKRIDELQTGTKQLLKPVKDSLDKQLGEAGKSAIGELVRGMIEGTGDFGKLLEHAMLQFVEKSITAVIVKALGILSPSKVAYGWGQNIVLGLVGGLQSGHDAVRTASGQLATAAASGSPSFHMTMNVPQARDPFSMARDADWQRAWRETALVAAGGGFKVP